MPRSPRPWTRRKGTYQRLRARDRRVHLPRARGGFTLLEMLVAVGVIGVLIAMLLPAIQASREAARRLQCSNNLSQLGVALRCYESAHGVLPSGVVNATGPIRSKPDGYHMGWIPSLLPYFDEAVTFQHVDFVQGAYGRTNRAVRAVRPTTLLCPSDPGAFFGLHYAGCHHPVEAPIDRDNQGVFFLNSRLRSRQITDGLSQTIFLGEKLGDTSDLGWLSGTRSTLRNTGTPLNQTKASQNLADAWPGFGVEALMVDYSAGADSPVVEQEEDPTVTTEPIPSTPGVQYVDEFGEVHDSLVEQAEERTAASQPIPDTPAQLYVGGFGSKHPGVVNFLFGDGAVRALSERIDLGVLQQLGNRADGRLLEDRSFE